MTAQMSERQIGAIVEKVVKKLSSGVAVREAVSLEKNMGIFQGVEEAVQAAASAQKQLLRFSLKKRAEFIQSIRDVCRSFVPELAEMAVRETGMGRVDHKVGKNYLSIEKTPGLEALATSDISGDDGMAIIDYAPYGVIASIIPSTNPSETLFNNGIGMMAGGNAVVFNPHPTAKNVSRVALSLMNQAVALAGGPETIFTAVENPTIETGKALFAHPGIHLVVVTGGPGVVRTAMGCGKKVIAAGPGNPPAVVDETADLDTAARGIIDGAGLDNNIVCTAEKEIIVVRSVAEKLKRALFSKGVVEITGYQLEKLMKDIFQMREKGRTPLLQRTLVGKDASVIAKHIGLSIPPSTPLLIAEVERNHPLVFHEQLMPLIPLVRVSDADEAIELAHRVEGGRRHTAVIYSRRMDRITKMGRLLSCNIFVANGPNSAGLGLGGEGYTSFTIAGTTGEGLTTARNFVRERRISIVRDLKF